MLEWTKDRGRTAPDGGLHSSKSEGASRGRNVREGESNCPAAESVRWAQKDG